MAWNDQVVATSLHLQTKKLHNNLSVRKPLYSLFYGGKRPAGPKKGQYVARKKPKLQSGGHEIRFPLKYDHLTAFRSVGEGDQVQPQVREGIGYGTASWKFCLGDGAYTWQQQQANRGKHQIVNIVEAIRDDLQDSAGDGIEAMCLLDGTGNGSKDLMGLAALIRPTPTSGTLFGISQATNEWWRNQYKSSYSAAFLSGVQGLKDMRSMWNLCSYQSKGSSTELTMPDVILTGTNPYESYEALGYELKRIGDMETIDLGFMGFKYKSSVILYVPGLDSYLGAGSTDNMLFLNTNHIYSYIDPVDRWRFIPFREMNTNQPMDRVCHVTFVAQMICDNLSRQGYLEWTDASA
ncbi:MAG: phage major capsid protein [Propionibacteriaceae bacterium]|nr:phage major capsid protein [Propionibacteriaceae bacterium]